MPCDNPYGRLQGKIEQGGLQFHADICYSVRNRNYVKLVMSAFEIKKLVKTAISPLSIERRAKGLYIIDFGKVWFGTLRFCLAAPASGGSVIVRLGEWSRPDGRVDCHPPAMGRFREIVCTLAPGQPRHTVRIPSLPENTGPRTLRMPEEIGEVMPFRYAEIEGEGLSLVPDGLHLMAAHYPCDPSASDFVSSDPTLNRVWALSKHTLIATTFCGLFVDGDRERYPREADAYIQQLGAYCVDAGMYGLARSTHVFMLRHTSRWTEWLYHSIFMAWMDLLYTGDATALLAHYEDLKAKLLLPLTRADGLVSTLARPLSDDLKRRLYRNGGEHVVGGSHLVDIVDWPRTEREDYDFRTYNTVVNAFLYRGLILMARMAGHIGRHDDAEEFRSRARQVRTSFQRVFFDRSIGRYVDGEGSGHSSFHANFFPLALGLVPPERKAAILAFLRAKGMACSPYGAQYLLEALFRNGCEAQALALMTADTERSWKHMLDQGATMTFEAWTEAIKPNMDFNHAWGAAPGNLLPRYVLGVRPATIGAGRVVVAPQPGPLEFVRGRVPFRQGPVEVACLLSRNRTWRIEVVLPEGTRGAVKFGGNCFPDLAPGRHVLESRSSP